MCVRFAHEWNESLQLLRLPSACRTLHCAGRSDLINGKDRRAWIGVGDCSDGMLHATSSCSCRQCKLKRGANLLNCTAKLARECFRHQSPERAPCGNSSDSSIALQQCSHCRQHETTGNCRCCVPGKILCCQEEEVCDFRVTETHAQHLVSAPTWTGSAPRRGTPQTMHEQIRVQSQRIGRLELKGLVRNFLSLFLWSAILQCPEFLVLGGPGWLPVNS